MSSNITRVCVGLMQTNCYIYEHKGDEGTTFLAVIDPGDSFSKIEQQLKSEPSHIILTHSHFDHIGALKEMLQRYPNAKLAVGEAEDMDEKHLVNTALGVLGNFMYSRGYYERFTGIRKPDIILKEGDVLGPLEVLHTPGHTKGSICLYGKDDGILFSGDTLFWHSYGRTDLGGSEVDMQKSLARLMALPPETKVFPGHEGSTTIGTERQYFGF